MTTNPLTEVLQEAKTQVRLLENVIIEEYGVALFTEEKRGLSALDWPDDPEALSPEAMRDLITIHGQDAVDLWLAEHYLTKQQADMVAAEEESDES